MHSKQIPTTNTDKRGVGHDNKAEI